MTRSVLLAALVLYAMGVLIASTTGGGEGSGSCEETPVVVDVCNDGDQQ